MIVLIMADIRVGDEGSYLHCEDGEDDDVVADFPLKSNYSVVVGVVPGHG